MTKDLIALCRWVVCLVRGHKRVCQVITDWRGEFIDITHDEDYCAYCGADL